MENTNNNAANATFNTFDFALLIRLQHPTTYKVRKKFTLNFEEGRGKYSLRTMGTDEELAAGTMEYLRGIVQENELAIGFKKAN